MKRLITLIVPVLFASSLLAQVTIVASVDKNPVGVGEKIQLKYTVINHKANSLNTPLLVGFEIVNGPSSAETTTAQNGVITTSGSVSYTLKAIQAGTFKIGKATLVDSGKTYASEEITVVVTESKVEERSDEKNL